MFVLVEYNDFYENNFEKVRSEGHTPVLMFKVIFSDKNSTRKNIENTRKLKKEIGYEYNAVQVILEKFDNSTTNLLNNLKNDFDIVIGLGGLNKTNRFFIDQTQIDFLKDPHNALFKPKMDFIHHFNSGLNQVLCKAAKEREIDFLFALNFSSGKSKNIAKNFGRMNQNLKFARKYKIPTLINFIIEKPNQIKSDIELNGIMSLFDISTEQKKESIDLLEKKINENRFKKSDKYIREGIEIVDK